MAQNQPFKLFSLLCDRNAEQRESLKKSYEENGRKSLEKQLLNVFDCMK